MGTAEPPQAKASDLLSAFGPLVLERGLKPKDFTRRYEGYLMVDEIRQFDDLAWMQVRTPEDLISFRHGAFDGPPREMPPIVVATYPANGSVLTEIRDGRGRVNFANAYGLRLHVWRLIHKTCLPDA
jgi:hypothetical protein